MKEKAPGSLTQSVIIHQYSRGAAGEGASLKMAEEVLVEYRLSLYVNERMLIQLHCLPSHLEELVVGYLFTEGLIGSYGDIRRLRIDEEAGRADVSVTVDEMGESGMDGDGTDGEAIQDGLVTTDAGDAVNIEGFSAQRPLRPLSLAERGTVGDRDAPAKGDKADRAVIFDPCDNWDGILENANRLLRYSKLFRRTGNVHSVMLCRGQEILCCMEDVGRFSAFDKCLGRAVMEEWPLEDTCIYTTGRVPGKLVLKAVRSGIPMLVSRSAPTNVALALAAEYGVAIVGFARGDRMNIY